MTTDTNDSNRPSHRVYYVKGEAENPKWVELGAAWPHKDGKGFTIELEALPIDTVNFNGRLQLRAIEPKK